MNTYGLQQQQQQQSYQGMASGMPSSVSGSLPSSPSSAGSITASMALDRLKIAEKAVYALTGQSLDAIVMEYVSRLPAASGLPPAPGCSDGFEELLTYISAYPSSANGGGQETGLSGQPEGSPVMGTSTGDVLEALLMGQPQFSMDPPSPAPGSHGGDPVVTVGSSDPLAGSPYSPLDMLLSGGNSPAPSPMPSPALSTNNGPTSPTYLGVPPPSVTAGNASPRSTSSGSVKTALPTDSAVTHQALVNHLHQHIMALQEWRRDHPSTPAVMTMTQISDLVRSITGDAFYDFQLMCVAQHKRALVPAGAAGTPPGSTEPCVHLDELIRVCARDWKVSQRKIKKRSTRGGSPAPGSAAESSDSENGLIDTPSDDPARVRAVMELRALDGLYSKLKVAPLETTVSPSWAYGSGDGSWTDVSSGSSIPSGSMMRLTLAPGNERAESVMRLSVLYRAEHGLYFLPLVLNKDKRTTAAHMTWSAASGPISIGGDSSGALSPPGTRIQEVLPEGKTSTVVSYTVLLRRSHSLTRLSSKFKVVPSS